MVVNNDDRELHDPDLTPGWYVARLLRLTLAGKVYSGWLSSFKPRRELRRRCSSDLLASSIKLVDDLSTFALYNLHLLGG